MGPSSDFQLDVLHLGQGHQQDGQQEEEQSDDEEQEQEKIGVSFSEGPPDDTDYEYEENEKDIAPKDTIKSRIMTHMLGGQASSFSECLLIIVGGQMLAFNSGFTNGACLSGFLLQSGRQQSVSAFTGAYTGSALFLADGHVGEFGFQICMILCFMLGASIAGLLTPKATPYRIEPTYGPTFLVGGAVLLLASILATIVDNRDRVDNIVFYFVAMSNGIQNGLSSLYSGNLIRSTHLTGTSTDIGLFTGQLLRGNNANNWKLIVLIALTVSFWTGGLISLYATQHFTSYTLFFNASLFLTVGLMLVMFLMRAHSISFVQAVLGTWKWKRALNKLSSHHSETKMRTPSMRSSVVMGELGQRSRLIRLFSLVDGDGDGELSPDELLAGLTDAGFALTMRDVRMMIKFADKDGNGVISRDEWHDLVDEIHGNELKD